jgi:hypothetical protein
LAKTVTILQPTLIRLLHALLEIGIALREIGRVSGQHLAELIPTWSRLSLMA